MKNNIWYDVVYRGRYFYVKWSDYEAGIASHVVLPLGAMSKWWANVNARGLKCGSIFFETEISPEDIREMKDDLIQNNIQPNKGAFVL